MLSETRYNHILFITSSRIGDAVLSTGLINHLHQKHPDARFTIVCGPIAASLFEGVPNLKKIIPLKKEKHNKHWIKLWNRLKFNRFDYIVDLRNSAVSRLLWASKRYIYGNHIPSELHKVEQSAAVMRLDTIPAPHLFFSQAQIANAQKAIPEDKVVLGVGPAANWAGKTWPVDRFIEIVKWMTAEDGVMSGAMVAVFAAPGEEEVAQALLDTVPADKRIDCIAKYDPGTAAALIAACNFYIGNDSGLMHCAAASGVPTLGLFGPSYPHLYSPWGEHTDYVSTPETFDQLIDFDGYSSKTVGSLMTSLTTDMVKDAVIRMFKTKEAA